MALSPPITKKPYNDHMKHIEKASIENAESLMRDATVRLVNITEKEDPGNIEINEDGGKIAKVAVTVDGTWQRRGHSSKIGVVFVISARTGEVLIMRYYLLSVMDARLTKMTILKVISTKLGRNLIRIVA